MDPSDQDTSTGENDEGAAPGNAYTAVEALGKRLRAQDGGLQIFKSPNLRHSARSLINSAQSLL